MAFQYALPLGAFSAVCAAVLGLVPGLIIVVILEGAKRLSEIAEQSKKQTALLEAILKSLKRD